jgi:hypothetical protein
MKTPAGLSIQPGPPFHTEENALSGRGRPGKIRLPRFYVMSIIGGGRPQDMIVSAARCRSSPLRHCGNLDAALRLLGCRRERESPAPTAPGRGWWSTRCSGT